MVLQSADCDSISPLRRRLDASTHPYRSFLMSAVAEDIQTQMPEPILFTDSAAAKVADLIAEEGNPDLKLRVFVQGGGCSGFQYGFTFD